jgi:hypothetical protein
MMLPIALAACETLAKLTLPNTFIDKAEAVTSGEFQTIKQLPSFCRVAGSIRPSSDSDIRFEVWMPLTGWNGKFQGIGNGGYAGTIGFGGLGGAIKQGYAAASTDTGHSAGNGIDASWALNHPEKIIDTAIAPSTKQPRQRQRRHRFYGSAPGLLLLRLVPTAPSGPRKRSVTRKTSTASSPARPPTTSPPSSAASSGA